MSMSAYVDDGKSWHQRGRLLVPRRMRVIAWAAVTLSILLCLIVANRDSWPGFDDLREYRDRYNAAAAQIPPTVASQSNTNHEDTKLHVVIPASSQDVNLCKLLLGCSLLGYPNPTLVAWNTTNDRNWLLGGGSHLAKISKVVEYLQGLDSSQDDELVLMLDAYDIHLQLPKSTLVSRYYELRDEAQVRLVDFTGETAVRNSALSQSVIFGAGKRCAPNEPHTVACYAIPDSPMPMVYGPNTDTVIGRNHYYSVRQRYLNSGFILGPAKAMRHLFKEAWALIEASPDADPLDNGSHIGDWVYHGSDQSVFATMYGRQEYAREKIRLQNAAPGTKPRSSSIFFSPIDNVLNPSFHHEEFDVDVRNGKSPYEYGIFLDFASDLGHQTINSEQDAAWITYGARNNDTAMKEQIGDRLDNFDCSPDVPAKLPSDITNAKLPTDGTTRHDAQSPWLSCSLYTHLCMSRIPVLRHMNGEKKHREAHWGRMWYVPQARTMFKELREALADNATLASKTDLKQHMASPGLEVVGAAWTEENGLLNWEDLCPASYDGEVFRDVAGQTSKSE